MNSHGDALKSGFGSGIRKGWHGFLWMMKILVPVSLFTAALQWSGWISKMDFLLQPIMQLLSLPASAALPLLIAGLTGVYGGIAAMAVLPFTREQMTLMAIFILIAHNLLQESAVQGQSGINPLKALLFRLGAAALTLILTAPFLGASTGVEATAPTSLAATSGPFLDMLLGWGQTTMHLSIKILVIIMSILTALEVLKALGWIPYIVKAFSPLLKLLGLSETVGILWITAAIFGLTYGAAVIVEEARRGEMPKEELEILHLSIGINHSMVEDPLLFLALGIGPVWLWVPRLLMAIGVVQGIRLWGRWMLRRAQPDRG